MPKSRRLNTFARQMRNEPTEAERRLWCWLRVEQRERRFRRQLPIGHYIADFVCLSYRLVIEVDGDQHANNDHDVERDQWLSSQGFRVLRFSNRQVMDEIDGVLAAIDEALARRVAALPPP